MRTATVIRKSTPPTIMSLQVLDRRFRHPFTCAISGLSQSGTLTFVHNVILKQKDLIDTEFDYVYIFLRTSASKNRTLSMIGDELCQRVNVLDVRDKYPSKEVLKENFPPDINSILRKHSAEQKKGCLIFDDLKEKLNVVFCPSCSQSIQHTMM